MLQRPDEIFNEASQTVGDPLERDALGGEAKLTGDRAIPRRLVVVSNRLGNIRDLSQAGGLAVGIGDALAERGGLWLGASAEYQDYAASDEPLIRLERVGKIETAALTLPYEEYSLYYNGYANSTLWPLFHYRLDLVNHRAEFLHAYRQINARFAKALAGLLSGNDDLVWVHDYHLIPLAAQLRRLGVRNRIGFFLHIPFPPPDLFVATPDHEELIDDLLQYDVVGFQTETDVGNFRRSVQAANSITFDINGSAEMNGRTVLSRCFPIGIDVDSIARMANEAAEDVQIDSMRRQILGLKQIIGVDRLDYSKGLPGRMQAFARLLERHPEHERAATYLQIASPTREEVSAYADIRAQLEATAGAVNGRYADLAWTPIRYIHRAVSRSRLAGLLRASQVGLVTPLRDGMNLVAKEYIAAQDEADPGVLVLSRFAGAAEELAESLIVNPYAVDEVADAIAKALAMPLDERIARHSALLKRITRNDAAEWRRSFLATLAGEN
ncbi:trehalose-6-phosphate synthase [Mesorhizobium sp. M0586]|uniref:alpha,alpha-trehalose-phosphate synthase (UDP-forming) n=1 Tax=unclassified Mesorhizobium TaxID=325217 RepID=UPI00333B04B0